MGGIGSGGHNKSHGRIEDFNRLDSFCLYDYIRYDKYLYCKEKIVFPHRGNKIIYYVKSKRASIDYGDGKEYFLKLSIVENTNFKSKRMYFLCPECERRVRYLYLVGNAYICRKCAGLNYKSQQINGQEEVMNKIKYLLEKKLQYRGDSAEHIADLSYIPKPPYMKWRTYHRYMDEYRRLSEEYYDYELKMFCRCLKIINPLYENILRGQYG
jgi:hypothetical protein